MWVNEQAFALAEAMNGNGHYDNIVKYLSKSLADGELRCDL